MQCYLDMDGVLVDFMRGIYEAHGKTYVPSVDEKEEYDCWHRLNMSAEEFFRPCQSSAFWSNLPWMSDGKEILGKVVGTFGWDNITILSKPTNHPLAASGKLLWLEKNIPQLVHRYILMNGSKALLAGKDLSLIHI